MLLREIIGQEDVKRQLRESVLSGHVAHAQMFCGASGVGKLQLAIAYAQYLACEHRTATDSCGECPTCKQFAALEHPDLHFTFPIVKTDKGPDTCNDFMSEFRKMILQRGYFDADDWMEELSGRERKQPLIYEKESSEIQRKLNLKAFGNGYKTMIIWQPERMNIQCANKLLKLLEEPPERTLFLFVTAHPEELLPTIQSRLRPIAVPNLSEQEIANALIARHQVDEQQAYDFAHMAHGSYRNAERMTEENKQQEGYLQDFQALMRNAWLVGIRQNYDALKNLNDWCMDTAAKPREVQKGFLQYCQAQVRENFIRNYNIPSINYQTHDEAQFSTRFAPFINERNVQELTDVLSRAETQINQNGNAKIVLFDLIMQVIVLIKK